MSMYDMMRMTDEAKARSDEMTEAMLHRAKVVVASFATGAQDLRELLEGLGLDHGDK